MRWGWKLLFFSAGALIATALEAARADEARAPKAEIMHALPQPTGIRPATEPLRLETLRDTAAAPAPAGLSSAAQSRQRTGGTGAEEVDFRNVAIINAQPGTPAIYRHDR